MTLPTNNLRVGVFYDGTYFSHVSNYYLHEHERHARISIRGLHTFVRHRLARLEGVEARYCQVIDAHYFRGRLSARQAQENDALFRERQFDDVLIREGVTMHFLPIVTDFNSGERSEKGIDVWLALEAFELARIKSFDVIVLITGDGDFVPLVRKLNAMGSRVMLLGWDLASVSSEGSASSTRVSFSLRNEVAYPIDMCVEIDAMEDGSQLRSDDGLQDLFVASHHEEFVPVTKQASHEDAGDARGVVAAQASLPDAGGADPLLLHGVVDGFNNERGFGFIMVPNSAQRYFFHITSVLSAISQAEIEPGARVSFHVRENARGSEAFDVQFH